MFIVYAYNIEPPLARWWQLTKVLASHLGNLAAFVAVDGCLGRLHVARCSRLNLDKAKHIFVPTDEINLAAAARRAEVASDDYVAALAQVEVRFLFALPADALMERARVWGQDPGRDTVEGTNYLANY